MSTNCFKLHLFTETCRNCIKADITCSEAPRVTPVLTHSTQDTLSTMFQHVLHSGDLCFPLCVCRSEVGELLWAVMGEIEGSYRVLQTPGTRLGAQFNAGVSTLEPGQSLSGNMAGGTRSHGRGLQIRVQGLDDSQEFFDVDVSYSETVFPPSPRIYSVIRLLFAAQHRIISWDSLVACWWQLQHGFGA